jgi:hypothetical protein
MDVKPLVYDHVRNIIECMSLNTVQFNEKIKITLRGSSNDERVYVYGENDVVLIREGREHHIVTRRDIPLDMLQCIENTRVASIHAKKTRVLTNMCRTSKEINRFLGTVTDEYTRLRVDVTHPGGILTCIQITKDQGMYHVLFQTGVGIVPVVDVYKRVRSHKTSLGWIRRTMSTVCPFLESFVTIRVIHEETLFDRCSDMPAYEERPFHEELLEIAWHPTMMRNCLDERDLDAWLK